MIAGDILQDADCFSWSPEINEQGNGYSYPLDWVVRGRTLRSYNTPFYMREKITILLIYLRAQEREKSKC